MYATFLADQQSVSHQLSSDRKGWIEDARGAIKLNDEPLQTGDGASIEGPATITLTGTGSGDLGVQAFLRFVRETCAHRWLSAPWLDDFRTTARQLRLE